MYVESRTLTTSDGTQLYNVIAKPKKDGTYPTLLIFSPYCKRYKEAVTPENWRKLNPFLNNFYYRWDKLVDEGYVIVYQHVRGRGNSTDNSGKWMYIRNQDSDNFETMKWLRKQDFYNGEIFRWGGSYPSAMVFEDLYRDYPDLKGIIASVPVPYFYRVHMKNGFFKTGMMGLFYGIFTRSKICNSGSWRHFPQREWPELLFGGARPEMDDCFAHPDENDPFWREQGDSFRNYALFKNYKIPTLFITSWYDHSVGVTMGVWDTIPEETRKNCAMIITAGGHSLHLMDKDVWPFNMQGSTVHDASPKFMENWLNHLRGKEPLEFVKSGTVTSFPECGNNIWYQEDRFSNGETSHTLYLNADRSLGEIPGEVSGITYMYDPYNPAEFYGGGGEMEPGYVRPGTEKENILLVGLTPQDKPNWRQDVISFVGNPFEENLSLKGRMSADVYVKSDCEDTCFYARVYIIKDGITYMLRDDITSLCYHEKNYIPGKETKVHFDFHPMAWNLKKGDLLRIDISSSCYPLYSIHTNVKGSQCDVERPKVAHNTVICGKSSLTYQSTAYADDDYTKIWIENRPHDNDDEYKAYQDFIHQKH